MKDPGGPHRDASSDDVLLSNEELLLESLRDAQARVAQLQAELKTATEQARELGAVSGVVFEAMSDDALVACAVAARVAAVAGEVTVARCAAVLGARWANQELAGAHYVAEGLPAVEVARLVADPHFQVAAARQAGLARRRAVHEVAVVCGVSEYTLAREVDLVRELPERLPAVWEQLLAPSTFDGAKAAAIHTTTGFLSHEQAQQVAAQAMAGSRRLVTARKVRSHAEGLAAEVDPVGYADACRLLREYRSVTFRADSHGVGSMMLTTSAYDIERIRSTLNAHLAQLPDDEPGQERLESARRADIAVDLLLHGPVVESPVPAPRHSDDAVAIRRPVAPKAVIQVMVPLSSVLGGDAPAELAGYGVIPAQYARELIVDLGATATWRCVITDDRAESATHGSVVGFGKMFHHNGYQPPLILHEFIATRDRTCQAAGCHRSAQACDNDHIKPYAQGGVTCDCNLHALCRHHPRLKHTRRGVILTNSLDDCPF